MENFLKFNSYFFHAFIFITYTIQEIQLYFLLKYIWFVQNYFMFKYDKIDNSKFDS